LRIVDHNSSQNVDYFIANSKNTKARIEKFYRKDAAVVYPPVDIGSKAEVEKGEYYLAGGRIARAKNPDLIIRAFLENGRPLKIFGKSFGGYEREIGDLLREKDSNVEYIGEINDDEKDRLMKGAKAFIFASVDEDFGIIPVESMMNGAPVIAQKSGGVLETIVEGKTGLFFEDFTIESLNNALKKFEKMKFNSIEIKKHAEKFGKKRFEKEIREFVEKHA
jgi:glycosyltransferase involved in cell wall biosynthesis